MKTLSAFDPFLLNYYVDDGDLTSSYQRMKGNVEGLKMSFLTSNRHANLRALMRI